MFNTKSNRNRKGRYSSKDRAPMTTAERAAHRQAMSDLQDRMKAEQQARHAAFNESLKATLAAKEVSQ